MRPALSEDELPEDWEEAASDCMEADPTTASDHSSQHAVAHVEAEQAITDHSLSAQDSSTAADGSQHAVAHVEAERAMTDHSAGVHDSSTASDHSSHQAVAHVEAEQGMTDHSAGVQDSSVADVNQYAVANNEEEGLASPDQGERMENFGGAAGTGSQHADPHSVEAQVRPDDAMELVNMEGTAHIEAAVSASSLPVDHVEGDSDTSAKAMGNHFSLAVDDRQDAAALDAFTQAESANKTNATPSGTPSGNPSGTPSATPSAAAAGSAAATGNNSIGSCLTEVDPPAHQAGMANDMHALDNLAPANVRHQDLGIEGEGVVKSSVLANSLATGVPGVSANSARLDSPEADSGAEQIADAVQSVPDQSLSGLESDVGITDSNHGALIIAADPVDSGNE